MIAFIKRLFGQAPAPAQRGATPIPRHCINERQTVYFVNGRRIKTHILYYSDDTIEVIQQRWPA